MTFLFRNYVFWFARFKLVPPALVGGDFIFIFSIGGVHGSWELLVVLACRWGETLCMSHNISITF